MNLALASSSTPTLSTFDPKVIPYQYQVIRDIRKNFDYSLGVHEILLSGSVGSAKSILMAHLAVTHCLLNKGANVMLGRKSLPDLKDTILVKVLDHMYGDLIEGRDYTFTQNGKIKFLKTGSEIFCRSWADKRYSKLRSYELSAAFVEELTENDAQEFNGFYKELFARVGRLPHIKEQFICCATNPDAPSHPAYDYFIDTQEPTRHVYYSVTTDNPFLPPSYIEQLKKTYTALEARRMIGGEWIELNSDVIYYAFDQELSLIEDYKINPLYPVIISYDFNIGIGKPMSVSFSQYIDKVFYFFDEVVVHGTRTLDTLDEADARGLLDKRLKYIIRGDATGSKRTTNYNKSDYDVIVRYLDTIGLNFELDVPRSNPPVRKRHLIVNGALKNAKGETRVKILKSKCPNTWKGLRLTKLKKGSSYIEDDSDEWQHITTALGYNICRQLNHDNKTNNFSMGRTI